MQVPVEEEDEFEPLFDYGKSQQSPILLDDDDDEEEDVVVIGQRYGTKRCAASMLGKVSSTEPASTEESEPVIKVVSNDEDWLPSPPKCVRVAAPSVSAVSTLSQLRQKRVELLQASEGALRRAEQLAKLATLEARIRNEQLDNASIMKKTASLGGQTKTTDFTGVARGPKVVLRVQDKNGVVHPIRIFMSDPFEKLSTVYAKEVGGSSANYVFRFDGDRIAPNATPKDLDMEDDDVVEVYEENTGESSQQS